MLNLIRSDLYRLFRSRGFQILLGSLTVYYIINAIISKYENLPVTFNNIAESLGVGECLIIAGLTAIIFENCEYKRGFIKHVVCEVNHKYYLPIVKIITCAVISLIISAVEMLVGSVAALCAFGKETFMEGYMGTSKLLQYVSINFVIVLAIIYCCTIFVLIFRNSTLAIILIILGSVNMIDQIIAGLANYFFKISPDVTGKYLLHVCEMDVLSQFCDIDKLTIDARGVWVALAYIAVATVGSCILMEKRDVL